MTKPKPDYIKRLAAIQSRLSPHESWLISHPADIEYFSGLITLEPAEREGLILVTRQKSFVFHGFFSTLPDYGSTRKIESQLGYGGQRLIDNLNQLKDKLSLTSLALDERTLTISEWKNLQKTNFKTNQFLALDTTILDQQKMIKDDYELEKMKKAGQAGKEVWKALLPTVKAGQTEQDVRRRVDQILLEKGADKPAFPTIVAFGDHTAKPHHIATDRTLTKEMPVLIDFGANLDRYRSDMTRSFWFGHKPDPEYTKIEKAVGEAYAAALELLKSSLNKKSKPVTADELDQAARQIIDQSGYGKNFIHTTGHGLGLDIHEQPSLHKGNLQEIKPGMAITIEPGIYLDGKFGYRYENTVLVEKNNVRVVTE